MEHKPLTLLPAARPRPARSSPGRGQLPLLRPVVLNGIPPTKTMEASQGHEEEIKGRWQC